MPPKLPESELDRLERYLMAPGRAEAALPLDMVQGLLTAVASGPNPVPREKWLAEVLGPGHAFASEEEEREITDLLSRFSEETARQLNEGGGFDFLLYGDEGGEEDLAAWAEGYLIGVDLAEPPWDGQADAEDFDAMVFPFLALTGQAKEMALESGEPWMGDEEEAKLLADIREGFADHLLEVRRFWFRKGIGPPQRREEPKAGRNEPCPCGSGQKYKNCHGR